ncbi:MAG: glycosyltransferase [Planctomycetota bacterium]
MPTVALLTLVNDRAQFAACQASLRASASPFPQWSMVEPNAHGWNAAQGLNHGLDGLTADWIVCVHQDVLFPPGWWPRLVAAVAALPDDVALAGVVGCERSGRFRGHIVDPNGHCYWPSLPHPALMLDEVLIAVRRSSGLRFSPDAPGFHCYGADLCLQAAAQRLRTMVIDAPLVHLSTGRLDAAYERAAQWLLAKWGAQYGHQLPMPALLLQDERRASWWSRLLLRLRRRRDRLTRNTNVCPDARCAARELAAARERVGVR